MGALVLSIQGLETHVTSSIESKYGYFLLVHHAPVVRPTQLILFSLDWFDISLCQSQHMLYMCQQSTYTYNKDGHAWQGYLLITTRLKLDTDWNLGCALDRIPPASQWKSILFRPPAEQSFTNEDAQSCWTGQHWIWSKPKLLFLRTLGVACFYTLLDCYISVKTFHKYLKRMVNGDADNNVGRLKIYSFEPTLQPAGTFLIQPHWPIKKTVICWAAPALTLNVCNILHFVTKTWIFHILTLFTFQIFTCQISGQVKTSSSASPAIVLPPPV